MVDPKLKISAIDNISDLNLAYSQHWESPMKDPTDNWVITHSILRRYIELYLHDCNRPTWQPRAIQAFYGLLEVDFWESQMLLALNGEQFIVTIDEKFRYSEGFVLKEDLRIKIEEHIVFEIGSACRAIYNGDYFPLLLDIVDSNRTLR